MKIPVFLKHKCRCYSSALLIFGALFGLLFLSHPALAQPGSDANTALTSLEIAMQGSEHAYERLEHHVDSWIALLITLSSVLIAVALNHSAPNVRTMGTFLAALGCFAVVGWFVFALNSGVISDPKVNATLFDGFKPKMLWIQTITSFLVGVFLLRVALWQSRRTDRLEISVVNSPDRFGKVSRYLHWVTAILFISLFPMGIFATMIPFDEPFRQGYYVVHKTIGFTVLGLLIVRLLWHRKTPTPALDSQLTGWERKSAKVAHILLYFVMIALPVTGFIMSTYVGKLSHFYVWDTPMLWDKNIESAKLFGLLHKTVLPYLCYVVIGGHILGALKHHFVDKHHQSIHRMVS